MADIIRIRDLDAKQAMGSLKKLTEKMNREFRKEILSFFVFKLLVLLLNMEKSLKVDRPVIKGILERFFLFLALVCRFPQVLIAFRALKIGTRFAGDENKISNDYFLIGNILSLLIALVYCALRIQFSGSD